MIKVGSDFSGVGAFNQALIRLRIPYKEVFACDWDKYARQTFVHNYGEPDYYPEDVYDREIPADPLDIYMTSPPCQAFSLAGKRKGEDDKRGILFYNSHEFIKKNRPRYFIFENVKGLLSDDNGRTFSKWLQYLAGKSLIGLPTVFPHPESVPYHVYYKVLNAKDYGIPQNRERVFIVGIRDDSDNDFAWPRTQFLYKRLRDVLETDVDEKYYLSDKMLESLVNASNKHRENGNGFNLDIKAGDDLAACVTARCFKMGVDDNYIYDRISGWHENDNVIAAHRSDEKRSTVSEHVYHKLDGVCTTIQTAHVPKLYDDSVLVAKRERTEEGKVIRKENRAKGKDSNPFQSKQIVFEPSEVMNCIGTSLSVDNNLSDDGVRIRKLTPRECFRLMDFPDSFTWPVSDTQAYKQAGNSICVGVLASIIGKLKL